ncbi:MAG: transporter associated domain-containing protein, partial [Saprospiraceae bacterium]|nr:transporter associated domain-containing protein [Saprospiraceae bacterium]
VAASVKDLAKAFMETRHSRLLITNGDIDHVLGYVHHQELLSNPKSIKKAMREITFVPETMSAKDMMIRMIHEEYNIACVVDEFGGTAGILTLEDILEEIFGEIEDEHDEEAYVEEQVSEEEFLFSGRLEVSYLNEKYHQINIPEGDYNTLSGYIVMTSGDIPEQGEALEMGGLRFAFESVTEKKIETIRVTVLPKDN